MSTDSRDEHTDHEIRRFLDLRADDTSRIRSAPDMSMAIAARILPAQDRARQMRLAWALAAAALVALMAASAVFVGNQRKAEVIPVPSVLPAPTVATVPSPAPATADGRVVRTGSEATEIGQVSWTYLFGNATNLPAAEIFETPAGYAAVEPNLDGPGARLWVSTDGLDWSVASASFPAVGQLSHGFAAGEHWLWSRQDFALWHSTDLVQWSEVEHPSFRPRAIDGIAWSVESSGPVTLGSATVIPMRVSGRLALDRLLGITQAPGELLIVSSDDAPALGAVHDVVRARWTTTGSLVHDGRRVGGIRVELDDPIVRIVDADHDRVVAEFDSTSTGMPAAAVAQMLHERGRINFREGGVTITDGIASATGLPAGLEYLIERDGRFVAMTRTGDGHGRVAWTSTDGIEWKSVGKPRLPETDALFLQPFDGFLEDPQAPLMSLVFRDTDPQRVELWTSEDGIDWDHANELPPDLLPWPLPSGGFLATTGDGGLMASRDGNGWGRIYGLTNGGSPMTFATREATFIMELPMDGERILWVVDVEKP